MLDDLDSFDDIPLPTTTTTGNRYEENCIIYLLRFLNFPSSFIVLMINAYMYVRGQSEDPESFDLELVLKLLMLPLQPPKTLMLHNWFLHLRSLQLKILILIWRWREPVTNLAFPITLLWQVDFWILLGRVKEV